MTVRKQLRRFLALRPDKEDPIQRGPTGAAGALAYGALVGLAAVRKSPDSTDADPLMGGMSPSTGRHPIEEYSGLALRGRPSDPYEASFSLSVDTATLLGRLNTFIASSSVASQPSSGRSLAGGPGPSPLVDSSESGQLRLADPQTLSTYLDLSGSRLDKDDLPLASLGGSQYEGVLGQPLKSAGPVDWLSWEGGGQSVGPSHALLGAGPQGSYEPDVNSEPLALFSPALNTADSKPSTATEESRNASPEESSEEGGQGLGEWLGFDLNSPSGFELVTDLPDTVIAVVDPDSIGLGGILPAGAVGGGGGGGTSVVDPGVATDSGAAPPDTGGGVIDPGSGGAGPPTTDGGGGSSTPPDTGGGVVVSPPDAGGGSGGGGGGGSGGGGGGGPVVSVFSGRVVDGAVQGAQVFVDYDQNSVWDPTEPVATTDANGFYSFAAGVDTESGPIVSLGGTDKETGSEIQILKAEAGSPYVTPVSTLYVVAEQVSPGSGDQLLASMQLSTNDLAYDPIESTDANSLEVLKIGASVMSMVTNAVALTSQNTGESASQAMESALKAIAQTDSESMGALLAGDSGQMFSVFTRAIDNSGAGVALDATDLELFTQTATLTAARTAAIALTEDKSVAALESMYQDAELAMKNIAGRVSELAIMKANGESISTALTELDTEYSSEAIASVKATIGLRRALEKASSGSGITTVSDSLSIDAPTDTGGASEKLFDLIANDSVTGFEKSELRLVSVGLFNNLGADRGKVVGFEVGDQTSSITLEIANPDSWGKVQKGMDGGTDLWINLITADGARGARLLQALPVDGSGTLKTVTIDMGTAEVKDLSVEGAEYVITEALPDNLSLEITQEGLLAVTNDYSSDKEQQFGSTNLIYIVAQEGHPEKAAAGFATLNVRPVAPEVSLGADPSLGLSRLEAGESAERDGSGGAGFTVVEIPLNVSGLGVSGALEIRGAPEGSQLALAGETRGLAVNGFWLIKLDEFVSSEAYLQTGRVEGLELWVPGDFSGDKGFKVIATSRYGGLASKTIETYTLSIEPTADGLDRESVEGLAGQPLDAAIALTSVSEGFQEESLFKAPVNGGSESTDPFTDFMGQLKAAIYDSDPSTPERLAIRVSVDSGVALVVDPSIKFIGGLGTSSAYFFDPPPGALGFASVESALSGLRLSAAKGSEDLSGSIGFSIEVGAFESEALSSLLNSELGLKDVDQAWSSIVNSQSLVPDGSIFIRPVSDPPAIGSVALELDGKEAVWAQTNHRLSDGRYLASLSFSASSSDDDGSEAIFFEVLDYDLRRTGSSLDLSGKTDLQTVVAEDPAGRSLLLQSAGGVGLVGSGKLFIQDSGESAWVTFSDLAAGKSLSLGGHVLTASSAMTGHEIAAYFASLSPEQLSGWDVEGGSKSVWRRFDASEAQGSFNVVSPSTISSALSLKVRAVAIDSVNSSDGIVFADAAFSESTSFTIPYKETPKAPTLTVIPALGVAEDSQALPYVGQSFVLSTMVKVEPAAGRTIDSLDVYVELGLKEGLDPNLRLVLKTAEGESPLTPFSGAAPNGLTGTVYKLPATSLGSVAIRASEHTQSTIYLRAVASDSTASGDTAMTAVTPASAPAELRIIPHADGMVDDIDPGSVSLPIGVETEINDWFDKVATVDEGETFNAKLLFKGLTSSGSVLLRSDGGVVLPSVTPNATVASKVDLAFSLTPEQIQSSRLTLVVKPEVAGKSVELICNSVDGLSLSDPKVQRIDLTVSGEAVEPDGSLFDVSGLEDTDIFIPSNISVNPDRLGFERVGIQASVTDDSLAILLRGAVFGIRDGLLGEDGSRSDMLFTRGGDGSWTIFHESGDQLDFSKLFFRAPLNFSGEVPFELVPFSKTLTSEPLFAEPSEIVVSVAAVAETPQFDDRWVGPSPLSLYTVEGSALSLPLDTMIRWESLTDLDERVNLGIKVADDIVLEKRTANGFKAIAPASVANGVASYLLSLDVTNWESELVGVYRLHPSVNYSSADPSGSSAGTAIADGLALSLTATSIEDSGAFTRVDSPLLVDLLIDPIVLSAPRMIYVSSGVTQISIAESAPGASEFFLPFSLARPSSSVLLDPSESLKIRVQLSEEDHERLGFYSGEGTEYALEGADEGWELLLTPTEYKALQIRGADFEYGSVPLLIQTVVSESWGGSSFEGSAVGLDVSLTPRANSFESPPSTSSGLSLNLSEDQSNFSSVLTLRDLINPGFPLDQAERVRYRVSVPSADSSTGEKLTSLRWLGDGSAPVIASPSVSEANGIRYLTYDLSETALKNYTLSGAENLSGSFTLKVKAYTQVPADAIPSNTVSAPVSVGSIDVVIKGVADTPTIIQPAAVSVLLSDPSEYASVPVQVYRNDPSEALSVKIRVDNVDDTADIELRVGSVLLTASGSSGPFEYEVPSAQIPNLSKLTVSSPTSKDFRGEGAIQLTVVATSLDGTDTAELSKTSLVTLYQSLEGAKPSIVDPMVQTFGYGAQTKITFGALGSESSGIDLPEPLIYPASAVDNLMVLIKNVPDTSFFTDTGNRSLGASLGEGLGLWVFRGQDLFYEDGTSRALILNGPDVWTVGVDDGSILSLRGAQIDVSAILSDPESGSSSTSVPVTIDSVTVDHLGASLADPLIVSMDGSTVASLKVTDPFDFELNLDIPGKESPLYWIDNSGGAKYAFLLKSSFSNGDRPGVDDLVVDFDELRSILSEEALSDNIVTLAEILEATGTGEQAPRLWFDSGELGLVEEGETTALDESVFPDLEISLPESVTETSQEGLVSLYQAPVHYGGSSGALYAMGIPYLVAPDAMVGTPSPEGELLSASPSAFVSVASTSVPEDAEGAITLIVNLERATVVSEGVTPLHLLKVYVDGLSAEDAEEITLSRGTLFKPDAQDEQPFWLMTEDVVGQPISLLGLPEDWTGELAFRAQAVATASVFRSGASVVETLEQALTAEPNATVVVQGVADLPIVRTDITGTLELGRDGNPLFEGGELGLGGHIVLDEALNRVANFQGNETLFIRVHVDSPGGYALRKDGDESWEWSAPEGLPVGYTPSIGDYILPYFDESLAPSLDGLYIDFDDFVSGTGHVSYELLSLQGGTYQVSQGVDISFSIEPVVDDVVVTRAELLKSSGETGPLLEGDPLTLFLEGGTADPNEFVTYQLLVGQDGSETAAGALRSVVGMSEILGVEKENSLPQALSASEWRLFEWVSEINSAGKIVADTYLNAYSVELEWDPFFNEEVLYQMRAKATDSLTGQSGEYPNFSSADAGSVEGLFVSSFVLAPQLDINLWDVSVQASNLSIDKDGMRTQSFVVEASGADPGEQGEGHFVIYESESPFSIDAEGNLSLVEGVTRHSGSSMPFEVAQDSDGYYFSVNQDLGAADPKHYYAAVFELEISELDLSYSEEYRSAPVFIELPSFAQPIELAQQAEGQAEPIDLQSWTEGSLIEADGLRVLGIEGLSQDSLERLLGEPVSQSDDIAAKLEARNVQIIYTLTGVPDWLDIGGGNFIGLDENGLSGYEFNQETLPSAAVSFERNFSLESELAVLGWVARNVDLSSFDTEVSGVVQYSVSKRALSETPIVAGPTQVSIEEGEAFGLDEFSILVPGFLNAMGLASVEESHELLDTLSVSLLGLSEIDYEVSVGGVKRAPVNGVYSLDLEELASTTIRTREPDDVEPFSFDLIAGQVLGFGESQTTSVSDPFSVSVEILNVPEDVTLTLAGSSAFSIAEGSVEGEELFSLAEQLGGFNLQGGSEGEGLRITLEMSSSFSLRDGSMAQLAPMEIVDGRAIYLIDSFEFNPADSTFNIPYMVGIPSGAELGSSEVLVSAQSFDPSSGAVGAASQVRFDLDVMARADDPELFVAASVEGVEDSEEGIAIPLTAFSPDPREAASLTVKLLLNGELLSPSDGWSIESQYLQEAANSESSWTLMIPKEHYEPIEVVLRAPENFYNTQSDEQGLLQLIEGQDLNLEFSAVSVYDYGDGTSVRSEAVTASVDVRVGGVNDAPTIDFTDAMNEFMGTVTESGLGGGGDGLVGGVSGSFSITEPDRFDELVFQRSEVGQDYGQAQDIALVSFDYSVDGATSSELPPEVLENILRPDRGFEATLVPPNIDVGEDPQAWHVDWNLNTQAEVFSPLGDAEVETGSATFDFLAEGETLTLEFGLGITDRPEGDPEHGAFNNTVAATVSIDVSGENDRPEYLPVDEQELTARLFLGAVTVDPDSREVLMYAPDANSPKSFSIDNRLIADGSLSILEKDFSDTSYLFSKVSNLALQVSGALDALTSDSLGPEFNDYLSLTNGGVLTVPTDPAPGLSSLDRQVRVVQWEFLATEDQYSLWGLNPGETLLIDYEIALTDREEEGAEIFDDLERVAQHISIEIVVPDIKVFSDTSLSGVEEFNQKFVKDNVSLYFEVGENLQPEDISDATVETRQSQGAPGESVVIREERSLVDEQDQLALDLGNIGGESFELEEMLTDSTPSNFEMTRPVDLDVSLVLQDSEGKLQVYAETTSFTLLPDTERLLDTSEYYDPEYEASIFGDRFYSNGEERASSTNFLDSGDESSWSMIDPQFGHEVLSTDESIDGVTLDGNNLAGTQGDDLISAQPREIADEAGSVMYGGEGADVLLGNEGRDVLIATVEQAGPDTLDGGFGSDVFLIADTRTGVLGEIVQEHSPESQMDQALETLANGKEWAVSAVVEGFSYAQTSNSDSIVLSGFDSPTFEVKDLGDDMGAAVLIEEEDFVSAILLPDFISVGEDEVSSIKANIHTI